MSPYEEKSAFFGQMEGLNEVENDELGEEEVAQRGKSRAFFKSRSINPLLPPQPPTVPIHPPRRVYSAPTPFVGASQQSIIEATPEGKSSTTSANRTPSDTVLVDETPIPDSIRPVGIQRSATTPLPTRSTDMDPSPSLNPAKKRKRSGNKPESPVEQIFQGFSFFYIPNNDVAPGRKMQIQRALEHGATWTRTLAVATHVIVDKGLAYKDIEKIIEPCLPEPSPVVVNENFPMDCVLWKGLVNPVQKIYTVPGTPSLSTTSHPPEGDEPHQKRDARHPLPLKEPQRDPSRWDYVPPAETPPPSSAVPPEGQEGSRQNTTLSPRLRSPPTAEGKVLGELENTLPVSEKEFTIKSTPIRGEETVEASRIVPKHPDELSQYIQLMQEYQDLPLDSDDDEDVQSADMAEEIISDSELSDGSDGKAVRTERSGAQPKFARKTIRFEDRFACNQGGSIDKQSSSTNHNARTIEILQSMYDYYERINDHWRTLAYRRAITTLKRQSAKITTAEEAFALPGIGPRLATKIEEIATTNKLRRLEYAQDDALDQVLGLFMGIYDVGNSRANKWIAQGLRTLQDLRDKAKLTPNQQLGLDHYDDLNSRIPQDEVTALGAYVAEEAAKLDASVELVIGGSYRRGSDSSGDIDFIVTKKGTTSSGDLIPFLVTLIRDLSQKDFITATLAALHSGRPSHTGPGSAWHGCCALPRIPGGPNDSDAYRPIWRRIDFLLVPETEFGAALIYFTGNDIFNRSIRLLASKKGMRLNQRGLFQDTMRGPSRSKISGGELVEGRDEKKIFEILGVTWRAPQDRWC